MAQNAKTGKNNSAIEESMKGCYGKRIHPGQVKNWIIDNVMENINRNPRITLNIMGAPGTSKTSIVKSLEKVPVDWNGKHYDGFKVIDIPIAQVEEMGDIIGFPVEEIRMFRDVNGTTEEKWIKASDSIINNMISNGWSTDGEQRTTYAPPSWVPKTEQPGILLLDDANRASQRILKGCMQLIQDYKTISWKIPNGWTIVLTGNPDNRFNQVTSMDTAQLSRMKFVTLEPDATEWGVWAESNGIDKRMISFVMRFKEMIIGPERTNPRTLAEFGRSLKRYKTLEGEEYKKCLVEAYASLDECTVENLMVFLQRGAELVIEPSQILSDYEKYARGHIKELMGRGEPRLDIIEVMSDRLYVHLLSDDYSFDESHVKNLHAFLLDKNIPNDTIYGFMRRFCLSDSPYRKKLLCGNKEIMKLVKLGVNAETLF